MTTFNVTLNNSVNLFGPQETNKWGSFIWGVDAWAYSQFDLAVTLNKLIENSLASDSTIVTLLDVGVLIENSMAIVVDMYDEAVIDSNGFYQVYGASSRNAENRPLTSYNNTSDITTSYTIAAEAGTSYTQVN